MTKTGKMLLKALIIYVIAVIVRIIWGDNPIEIALAFVTVIIMVIVYSKKRP